MIESIMDLMGSVSPKQFRHFIELCKLDLVDKN